MTAYLQNNLKRGRKESAWIIINTAILYPDPAISLKVSIKMSLTLVHEVLFLFCLIFFVEVSIKVFEEKNFVELR